MKMKRTSGIPAGIVLRVIVLLFAISAGRAWAQASENVFIFNKTIYAAPSGLGTKTGTSEANACGLQEAIESVKGSDAKIVLLDGTYRGRYTIGAGSTVLILEAKNSGQAIISGSDRFSDWTGPDGNGVWQAAWQYKWGTSEPSAPKTYMKRHEMLFIDNNRMTQKVHETDASKPVTLTTLAHGEFTVDESAGKIFFKPPQGKNPNSSLTEVSVRGVEKLSSESNNNSYPLLAVSSHDKIKIKGIVFKHSASKIHDPGTLNISSNGKTVENFARDVLIENCDFIENNGVGFSVDRIRGLTVRNCRFNDNGERGAGMFWVRRVAFEWCEFARNNWRFDGYMEWWDAGGIKIFDGNLNDSWFVARSDTVSFVFCKFIDNQSVGLWNDYGARNLTVTSCLFENNKYCAIFQEVTAGPLLISKCVVRRNGWSQGGGIRTVNSPDVTIDSCTIYNNGKEGSHNGHGNFLIIGDNRVDSDGNEYKPVRVTITNSTIQALRPFDHLFTIDDWNADSNVPKKTWSTRSVFALSLRSNNNRWFRADAPTMPSWMDNWKNGKRAFLSSSTIVYNNINDYLPDLLWEEWQTKEYIGQGIRQDQNSTWEQVPLADMDKLDPTKSDPVYAMQRERLAAPPLLNPGQRHGWYSITGRKISSPGQSGAALLVKESVQGVRPQLHMNNRKR